MNPLKVNCVTTTFGTKTVKIYKRIAFERKEKNPSVTTFKGSENKLRIGFKIINKNDRIKPEKRRVVIPPLILTPDKTWERTNRAIALKIVFLKIVFISKD